MNQQHEILPLNIEGNTNSSAATALAMGSELIEFICKNPKKIGSAICVIIGLGVYFGGYYGKCDDHITVCNKTDYPVHIEGEHTLYKGDCTTIGVPPKGQVKKKDLTWGDYFPVDGTLKIEQPEDSATIVKINGCDEIYESSYGSCGWNVKENKWATSADKSTDSATNPKFGGYWFNLFSGQHSQEKEVKISHNSNYENEESSYWSATNPTA